MLKITELVGKDLFFMCLACWTALMLFNLPLDRETVLQLKEGLLFFTCFGALGWLLSSLKIRKHKEEGTKERVDYTIAELFQSASKWSLIIFAAGSVGATGAILLKVKSHLLAPTDFKDLQLCSLLGVGLAIVLFAVTTLIVRVQQKKKMDKEIAKVITAKLATAKHVSLADAENEIKEKEVP